MGCIVSTRDTPRRALARLSAKRVTEHELADKAPRVCGLNGNGRYLVALLPRRSNGLLVKEVRIGWSWAAMNLGEPNDVDEAR